MPSRWSPIPVQSCELSLRVEDVVMVFDDLRRHLQDPHELRLLRIYWRCDRRRRSCARNREYDYGAGGGNFIGVSVGVDASCGIGVAVGAVDGDSATCGDSESAAVAAICGDDIGDACDGLERRSLENGISAISATSIGTTTAATTAHFVQNKIFDP